jgi:hypothetical protein
MVMNCLALHVRILVLLRSVFLLKILKFEDFKIVGTRFLKLRAATTSNLQIRNL